MKAVLTAASHPDAALIRNMLEQSGISASLVQARGHAGQPYMEVWVDRDEDSDRAVTAIRRFHASRPEGAAWSCAKCGEENPSTFELCWKCGASH